MSDNSIALAGCGNGGHVIAGVYELYEQLLPTRVYRRKTRTGPDQIMCWLCGKAAETVAHILAGCSALTQTKYLQWHYAVLKIIFFEMLHSLDLVDSVLPWYSPSEPKPVYQNDQVQAFWDVPVYADHVTVRANRVDARSSGQHSKICHLPGDELSLAEGRPTGVRRRRSMPHCDCN